jgi:general secretion pathway protein A
MIADDSLPGRPRAADAAFSPDREAAATSGPRLSPVEPGFAQQIRRPIYAPYYGFLESPFDLTPNPRFLFLPPRHREALANLRYGLTTPKGFLLLVGDAGTGKTTLVRTALSELGQTPNRYVFLHNPSLARNEFYEYLAREFNLSADARTSKTRFLAELQRDIEGRFAAGGLTSLIIDEAQSMSDELLEEVRLLGNIESATVKFLNIVLSGQPELAARLNSASLRQLKQRLALRCELSALTVDETAAYISGRLRIAGATPRDVFTRDAVVAIHAASTGIPRTINVLCENALLSGFASQTKPISHELISEVCRDFELGEFNKSERAAPVSHPPEASADAGESPSATDRAPSVATPMPTPVPDRPMFGAVDPPKKRRFRFF